jgi:hypothetical protein
MDSSLFFQFLNVIARNKTAGSEELRSAFALALASHEISTALVEAPVVAVAAPKVMRSELDAALLNMRNEITKEVAPATVEKPVKVVKIKQFNMNASAHIAHFYELIKQHLDMRSNISKEKARAIMAAIDGCAYETMEERLEKQLKKAV